MRLRKEQIRQALSNVLLLLIRPELPSSRGEENHGSMGHKGWENALGMSSCADHTSQAAQQLNVA